MVKIQKYCVHKYFGHFWQCWDIEAESKEDAWKRAEKNGKLDYQAVYRELKDTESKGYVVILEEKSKVEKPITEAQYNNWLREAISLGMIVQPEEYEKVYGLPFHDVIEEEKNIRENYDMEDATKRNC